MTNDNRYLEQWNPAAYRNKQIEVVVVYNGYTVELSRSIQVYRDAISTTYMTVYRL